MDLYCSLCEPPEGVCCGKKDILTFKFLIKKILRERERAESRGQPATLTLMQYLEALEYFSKSVDGNRVWACTYCGLSTSKLSIDHWQAIWTGGGTTQDNCVPSCLDCNTAKGSMSGDEFFAMLIHRFEAEGAAARYAWAQQYFSTVRAGASALTLLD